MIGAGVFLSLNGTAHSGGETRTLSLYHIHTKERLTITYMKDGKYIPSAMKKINYLMRDWRRNEVITISPRTIDLMWELHADLGSKRPVHIVSGYRSPKTIAFLKKIGRNVAKKSQHMVGHAIDLYFPDVPTIKIRNSALVRQVGGVGYYRSGGGPTGSWASANLDTTGILTVQHQGPLTTIVDADGRTTNAEGGIDYDKLIVSFGCSRITEDLIARVERLTNRRAHRFLRADRLIDKPPGLYLSSFRCISAFVRERITANYEGPYPYVDGLVFQVRKPIRVPVVLAPPLPQAITERIARGEQSLLLLNRRGYAPVLHCSACSWKSGCPHCSAWRVFHKLDRTLRCHHCGFTERVPRACPECGNLDIQPVGRGTERLEEQLAMALPGARVARIDADTTRHKGALEAQLGAVHAGDVDILVGTQMVAKGHDFRRVTLVAAVNPDTALFSSDFRAPERLFARAK